jgi:hypothetical protein
MKCRSPAHQLLSNGPGSGSKEIYFEHWFPYVSTKFGTQLFNGSFGEKT